MWVHALQLSRSFFLFSVDSQNIAEKSQKLMINIFVYRKYGLKPIAAEDYGNMEASFYVVAAAWKRNPYNKKCLNKTF
jgi:hypothetical protein